MSRKHILLLAASAVLVAANTWQWWPRASRHQTGGETGLDPHAHQLSEFKLQVALRPGKGEQRIRRNLFRAIEKAPVRQSKMQEIRPAIITRPQITPAQLAAEDAKRKLAAIKAAGIVVRDGKRLAFLIVSEKTYIRQTGEILMNRFRVDKVTTETVYLVDPETNVSRQIPVSGK